MCGIAGWAGADSQSSFDERLLRRMTDSIAHRGPDGEGYLLEPGVALGHRRLAILDPAHGAQPFESPSGRYVVTYNGEIYNAPEIRRRLSRKGVTFHTSCDTEVLVALADERGFSFLPELNGIFAFGLWDRAERRLLLAVDPLGVKPLVYTVRRDGIRFASELKALRAEPHGPWTLDHQALSDYLSTNWVPAPRTIHREARRLEPGEALTWQGGALHAGRYWVLPVEERNVSMEVAARELRSIHGKAVARQLQSDVPLGVFLSAGADSAAILQSAVRASSKPVTAYCLGFREQSYDERPGARETARRLGVQLVELEQSEGLLDTLEGLARHFDEPLGDSSCLATWQLCRETSRHVKVALAGDGGDELFGGYEVYRAQLLAGYLRRLGLEPLAALAGVCMNQLPVSTRKASWWNRGRRFLSQSSGSPARLHYRWKEIFTPAAARELVDLGHSGERCSPAERLWRQCFREAGDRDPVAAAMCTDIQLYLPNNLLRKVDWCSMAHGLEVRVPFLDRGLVEWAVRLPSRLKVGLRARKRVLAEGFAGTPIREVFSRPKQGFSVPASEWLAGPLASPLLDLVNSSRVRDSGLVKAQAVEALLRRHQSRREDASQKLWGVLSLALWLRHWG